MGSHLLKRYAFGVVEIDEVAIELVLQCQGKPGEWQHSLGVFETCDLHLDHSTHLNLTKVEQLHSYYLVVLRIQGQLPQASVCVIQEDRRDGQTIYGLEKIAVEDIGELQQDTHVRLELIEGHR